MALNVAKLYLEELCCELHSLHMMKFSILDQIEICMKLSDILSDILFILITNIRVRVREMLMKNCETLHYLKTLFKLLHGRLLEINEKKKVVSMWIERHEN